MIAKKIIHTVFVLYSCLNWAQALNESFPFVSVRENGAKTAAVFDQQVYLSTTNDDTNTYYSLSIRQERAQNDVNLRIGFQWLRNVTNLEGQQYRGVVFQVFTSFSSNDPIISIQNAENYFVYQRNGGTLNQSEYLDSMILGEQGLSRSVFSSDYIQNLRGQVIKNEKDVIITLNFTIDDLDPIGDHRVWYRWIFFNNIIDKQVDHIQGNVEPYFYGTYVSIGDFFDVDSYLNIYYIVFACSMFWLYGWPFVTIGTKILQWMYFFQAWDAGSNFNLWPGSENYQFELWEAIILGGAEIWITTTIIDLTTLIPFVAPPVNFLVTLYMYISYLYQSRTDDRRLYYGADEDILLPLPQVIEHDAFFDIHFPRSA